MATSGSVKTNETYNSYFWVEWSQNGNQDISNNRTPIKWSCGLYSTHKFYSNAVKMSGFSINGTQVYSGGTYSNFTKEGKQTIASGTMWINHNANGSKTFKISSFTGWLYSNYNFSASESEHTLTTIPRQATITSAPDFTDEQNPTINYSNLAGNAVTSLMACISFTGDKDDIAYRDISKTGTSYTFNLTDAEKKVLQSNTPSKTRTVIFYVQTILAGVTYRSTLSKTLTIVNGNPTFTASQISYADTSMVTDTTENPQHIVQNQSNLKVTVGNATAKKEATISKYDITVNGVKKTLTASGTADFGRVNSSANIPITVTVTDSRGFTTTATKNITILPWSLPTFTVSLERLNNYEDETYLTVDASISSVNNKNTMRIWYEYAERDGIYSIPTDIDNNTQYTLILDKAKTYDFNIVVEDAFDYSSKQFVVDKGKFPLFIDTEKNAVGINDFPAEGEALCVAEGVARFNDGIVLLSANKKFLVKITDSGALSITEMKEGE